MHGWAELFVLAPCGTDGYLSCTDCSVVCTEQVRRALVDIGSNGAAAKVSARALGWSE
jgi:hypothetical protein